MPLSRCSRAAKPMWSSVSPWVSTSALMLSRLLPIAASSRLSSFQYPGRPASMRGDVVAVDDQVAVYDVGADAAQAAGDLHVDASGKKRQEEPLTVASG
jgi:hypothetical protein